MRQVIIKIPKGNQDKIFQAIEKFEGKNTFHFSSDKKEVYFTYLPNEKVNNFLKEIDELEELEIVLIPRGVVTLYPPASEAPQQATDVQTKSSLEIYLGGIQSVGSLFGLVAYSFVAGIIVWIGLFTTTTYLLVAAMLVAPFAGPAMNAALGTAAGKMGLLKSSLGRYGLAIGTGIIASILMSIFFPLNALTPLMEEVSQVSKFAIFLPLVSGFAGAINICQSERDSLVSGAAVGILVAASLAPPVGLIGIGLYMGDWQVVFSSLYRIVLQLLGIHFAATLVFYFYGKVTPNGVRFVNGKKRAGIITTAIILLAIGSMMFWQFKQPPFYRKASLNTELTDELNSQLRKLDSSIVILNKSVSFTNTKYKDTPVAIFKSTVLKKDPNISDNQLKTQIITHLKENMKYEIKNLYEVYQIDVVSE
ncbi:DUF389 domain-containing protein [Salegentibacter agarivorans]|uniref:Uncharacterized hydrophobic domain-containing protein n=1 Tax=Salegentibacter agarivorans TaxID=345907 RepID=A0A1I2NHG9_9FLAO|nr:DUF389 domain-containing protein [Salegentibacter agarivorans]SFG00751.1 uncharacterized hydrophobic domain-containing protein [Salegentibacter agarivorans]